MESSKIIVNYANDENLINQFHDFISKVFPSISFKKWHSKGFWDDNYIPYSIISSGKIISNLCVAVMDIWLNDQKINAIQIGAVGTLPEHRNQGLSRELLNYVLDKYEKDFDLIFLFANETVMEFYPKFGFKHIKESIFEIDNIHSPKDQASRKLNLEVESDNKILTSLIKDRIVLTKRFGAEDHGSITMWHILNIYFNDLFFLEQENIIFIKKEKDQVLHIIDIISRSTFEFESVIPKIIHSESIKTIHCYFPPDQLTFNYDRVISKETGLFVRGTFTANSNLIKFPETAHT